MSQLIKKIKTADGDLQIDYNALANLPTTDKTLAEADKAADAKAVGDIIATKAPAYTYSDTDLTEGVSALETGKLYFVYE